MRKKILFIDRDGTIIKEPEDLQVDSLDKLEFLPYAISSLKKLSDFGYVLVMVSNQDGKGTDSFPEEQFEIPQGKMLTTLKNEGAAFEKIFIDNSFENENSNNRKPNIGMLFDYLKNSNIDYENSYVIGDRVTDIEFAVNLGCKSIFIGDKKNNASFSSTSWLEIATFLTSKYKRKIVIKRNTSETSVALQLNLDGNGEYEINTGIKFYDHMLEQFTKHSGIDLKLAVAGDLEVDEHHTIEDSAIVLGEAFKKCLGDKKGIERYGFLLPMEDSLVQCAVDFSGRPWVSFEGKFEREFAGDFPTEMLYHWLKSFADNAGLCIHIKADGTNTHHKVEAVFKALAKSIRQAVKVSNTLIPSTKGILQ